MSVGIARRGLRDRAPGCQALGEGAERAADQPRPPFCSTAGTDVYYVSRTLGHADITLTVHTYGAWLKPHRRTAVDVLDRTDAADVAEVSA
jgi:hypothetical protein